MKWLCILILLPILASAAKPLPKSAKSFLESYCTDCHDEEMYEAKLNLDFSSMDWSKASNREHWSKIIPMLERGKMPPKKKKKQPTAEEKKQFITWLDQTLSTHSRIGGTVAHRLNHREYLASVQNVFQRPEFKLPAGFPRDGDIHHFDTEAKSLLISPTHLEMYQATARNMADYLLPPDPVLPKDPYEWHLKASGMTTHGAHLSVFDDHLRLIKRGRNMGTSVPKFLAPLSGIYEISITVSANLDHKQKTAICEVIAEKTKKRFTINDEKTHTFTFQAPLLYEQSVSMSFPNAHYMMQGKGTGYTEYIKQFYLDNPKYINALAKIPKISRAIAGWTQIQGVMKQEGFNPNELKPESDEFKQFLGKALQSSRDLPDAISYHFFENGPWLDIHHVDIKGPLELIDDIKTRRKAGFLKRISNLASDKEIMAFFKPYVERAYRRNISDNEVNVYVEMVKDELKEGRGIESGLHLAIRMLLISPNFIFKAKEGQTLTDFELVSRLSYFLLSQPPSPNLMKLAQKGNVNLGQISEELLNSKKGISPFIKDFCDQWLDLNLIEGISVDNSLLKSGKKFTVRDKKSMQDEVYKHFEEMLNKNLPITDFIDPDFIYADKGTAEIYGVKGGKDYNKFIRIPIKRGSRKGGLLTMPGIMTATANGVDTQPVIRGIWMLENILGTPPPAPPDDVPPISPDVTGAITLKEIMAKHMEQKSCASCHQDIDPIGFVFENFDAIGQWRSHYPAPKNEQEKRKKNAPAKKGLPVDATGIMPDGTKLEDIRDLKAYLVKNPEYFSRCLSEKILNYATGRKMNYAERKLISQIVDKNLKNKQGFRDLFMELIDSEIFKAR